MKIILPYPNSELMPNRKNGKHWGATVKAKDAARDNAYFSTLEVLKAQQLTHGGLIPLQITFVQADKRHRDLDNLLAASKPTIDGIAKALRVDDSIFEPITILRGFDKPSRMIVEL
jgi:crossover junction endodeoxyribonuclease RusA